MVRSKPPSFPVRQYSGTHHRSKWVHRFCIVQSDWGQTGREDQTSLSSIAHGQLEPSPQFRPVTQCPTSPTHQKCKHTNLHPPANRSCPKCGECLLARCRMSSSRRSSIPSIYWLTADLNRSIGHQFLSKLCFIFRTRRARHIGQSGLQDSVR